MKTRSPKRSHAKPEFVPALDQGQIIQAALDLLEEVGFDGLTMRSLASRLGIKAASLYWHIRSKQDLLSLMANEISAPMYEPKRNLPWQSQLGILGKEYRQVLLGHRDAARVLAASGAPSGPNLLRLSEILLRTLLDAGFDHKDAAYAGMLVNDYVVMFVAEETRHASAQAENLAVRSPARPINWLEELPPEEYPSLVALAQHLLRFDGEERFLFGMEIMTNGLEARLAKSRT